MNIQIEEVLIEKKPVLRNLLELYKYDFSEFDGEDINDSGLYGCKYLDYYWTENGRYTFIIRIDNKIAEFILIRSKIKAEETIYFMSEFFILKKYRGNGIGRKAEFIVFDRFPGIWVVGQIPNNIPAQKFWTKVINEYTGGNFEEVVLDDWDGPVQRFNSSK